MLSRRYLSALLCGALTVFVAMEPVPQAKASEPVQLTAQDREDLARLEAYLRSIDTLEGRFVQVSSDGGFARGSVWLDRPGRMRFEYDDPVPILLIANGLELLYYDRELEQPTFVPLWQTPLWMVLRERATLTEGIDVVGLRRSPAELSVRIREANAPDRGELVLRFAPQPLSLLGWTVIDVQGVATEVSLVDPRWGVSVDSERFESRHLPNIGLGRR